MGDGHDGTRITMQELLEPQDRLGVEVVGRLVKKQQVGSLKQQSAECHTTTLAAAEHADWRVGVGALECVHCLRELAVEVPAIGGVNLVLQAAHLVHQRVEVGVRVGHLLADGVEARHLGNDVGKGLLDVLAHGLVLVKRRLLLQQAHGIARREARLAVGDVLEPRHDLEQRGLAHAVRADHADLGTGIDTHGHIVEDDLVSHGLAGPVHLVHEFCHWPSTCAFSISAINMRTTLVSQKWWLAPRSPRITYALRATCRPAPPQATGAGQKEHRKAPLQFQLVHFAIVGKQAVGLFLHVGKLRVHKAGEPFGLQRVGGRQ